MKLPRIITWWVELLLAHHRWRIAQKEAKDWRCVAFTEDGKKIDWDDASWCEVIEDRDQWRHEAEEWRE